jgi:hypothetical protein
LFRLLHIPSRRYAGLVLFLTGVLFLLCAGPGMGADEDDTVHFAKSGNQEFSATLVPDPQPGMVPDDPSLVEVTAGNKPTPFTLEEASGGQARLGGTLPGLKDGRHKAVVTTWIPEGGQKDRKQLLLFVDSTPPVIELVEPTGDNLPRCASSLRFRVSDGENGSGVAADPDACGLQVDVAGAAVELTRFTYDGAELCLQVVFQFPGSGPVPGSDIGVTVSLKDRAGNTGRFTKSFSVDGLVAPAYQMLDCSHLHSYIETAGEFLIEPSLAAFSLDAGASRQLQFITRGYAGKNHVFPNAFIQQLEKAIGLSEIFELQPYFQKAVGDRITVTTDSATISIQKTADNDFKDSQVTFVVSQNNPAPVNAEAALLHVTYPATVQLKASNEQYCAAGLGFYQSGEVESAYDLLPEEVFVYTYKTITIPVFLETTADPVQIKISQEDNQLTARVGFVPIELMDTAASWFAFGGNKYWFEQQGDVCVASGPAWEGTIRYQLAAAHKIARFEGLQGGFTAEGNSLFYDGDILVRMNPPVIENFRYDREKNTLYADIHDQGTPPDELDIDLRVAGTTVTFVFDPATGKLSAELPYTPLAVLFATLSVTDRAHQKSKKTCTVMGEVEEDEEGDGDGTDPSDGTYAVGQQNGYTANLNARGIERIIGTASDGMTLVEVCDEYLQWGYHSGGRFVPLLGRPETIRPVQLWSRDINNINASNHALWRQLPMEIVVFGASYDASRYRPAPATKTGGRIETLTITGGRSSATRGEKIYFAVMAIDGSRHIPLRISYGLSGLSFTTRTVRKCRVEERDIQAPVVTPIYDPATSRVTANIHDHGMPLDQLKIGFSGRSDSRSRVRYSSRLPYQYANGRFSGLFELPEEGELFDLEIRATDRAGNTGIGKLDISVPRTPPEVELSVVTRTTDASLSRNAVAADAMITAEAKDDSGIREEDTTLWVDDTVLPAFMRADHRTAGVMGRATAFWESDFHYKADYVARVSEGTHLARFKATDATGLSAEISQPFTFNLAPFITHFHIMPYTVQSGGGPAFTARVIDPGGDLDKDGLTFTIDGDETDASAIFYDRASGYFAVDGPLDLADGRHKAHLTAVDSRGNRAEDTLLFARSLTIDTPGNVNDGALSISGLSLMELENHNGDGRANPGELVRLFLSLRNDTDRHLSCIARLSAEDIDIAVETESLPYENMDPGSTLVPLQGFGLRLEEDILEKTSSDPYETDMTLRLDCRDGRERVLPFMLPIFQPTLPAELDSGVTVALDRLPPTTTEEILVIRGEVTSTQSFIEEMILLVNGGRQGDVRFVREGGRFEVPATLAEGNNTIEVHAGDETGARGSDAGFIFRANAFVPPSITITAPTNGQFFQCNDLVVSGTYTAGSANLDSITVDAPWEFGDCPVTIIDDSHFTVNCGSVAWSGGTYDVEATIETDEGVTASDEVSILVGDCS